MGRAVRDPLSSPGARGAATAPQTTALLRGAWTGRVSFSLVVTTLTFEEVALKEARDGSPPRDGLGHTQSAQVTHTCAR